MSLLHWFRSVGRRSTERPAAERGRFRPLGLESLESRCVLAGNVVASLSGTTLTLTGDDLANSFNVIRSGSNVVVSGLSGTSIVLKGQTAGASSRTFAVSDFNKLSISIVGKGGDDVVTLGSTSAANPLDMKSLSIDLGVGADRVFIDDTRLVLGGSAKITLGTSSQLERDQLSVYGLYVDGNLTVATGGGNDFFNIDSDTSVRGKLSVDLGTGDDDGWIDSGAYGSIDVRTGDGNDSFYTGLDTNHTVHVTATGAVSYDFGNGNDRVTFGILDFNSTFSVKTGAGDDQVTFKGWQVARGAATLDLGEGNNTLTADSGVSYGQLTLKAGSGNDTIGGTFGTLGTGKVLVQLGGGNDTFLMTRGIASVGGSVDIQLGEGNNRCEIHGYDITGGFKLTAGSGNDVFIMNDWFLKALGAAEISLGNGTNQVDLDHLQVGKNFTYKGGTGYDRVDLAEFLVGGNVLISTGAGDDVVTALTEGLVAGTFDLQLGEGYNSVAIQTLFAYTAFKYSGGNGIDRLYVYDWLYTKNSTLKFGGGNDLLDVYGWVKDVTMEYVEKIDVDMGAGNDTYRVQQAYAKDVRVKLGVGVDTLNVWTTYISDYVQVDGGADSDTGNFSGGVPSNPAKVKVTGFEFGDLS